jgi:hypothetical protein
MTASAAENIQFQTKGNVTLSPIPSVEKTTGYYRDKIVLGEHKRYTFVAKNQSAKNVTVSLYPSDVMTGRNGGSTPRPPEEANTHVGSWYTTGKQEVMLGPFESKQVHFDIRIPDNISKGQYYGSIALYESGNPIQVGKAGEDQAALMATSQYISQIQTVLDYDVDKAIHLMDFEKMSLSYASGVGEFSVFVKNLGTILEKPTGNVMIKDSSGAEFFRTQYQTDSIYPSTTGEIYIKVAKVFPPGEYTLVINGNFSGKTAKKDIPFEITSSEFKDSVAILEDRGMIESTKFSLKEFIILHPVLSALFGLLGLLSAISITAAVIIIMRHRKSPKRRQQHTVGL